MVSVQAFSAASFKEVGVDAFVAEEALRGRSPLDFAKVSRGIADFEAGFVASFGD